MPPANDDYRKRLAERKRLLARESQKRRREKAFSTPAPARFGVKTDTKQDRVTSFGKPFASGLLTENQTAKTIDRFAGQMLRRYSINPIKSARDVAVDTVSGGEDSLKKPPWWLTLVPGVGIGGAAVQANLWGNEKVGDVIAPADLIGAGGILRGVGKAATSKYGKAALGTIGAGLGFGTTNTEKAEAISPATIQKPSKSLLGAIFTGTEGLNMQTLMKAKIPRQILDAKRLIGQKYDSGTERAVSVGKSLEDTLRNRADEAIKEITDYKIGDKTLSDHMEEEGLAPFRSWTDRLMDEGEPSVFSGVRSPVSLVTDYDVTRNLGIMEQLSQKGSEFSSIGVPILPKSRETYLPHGGAIFENDHGNALSWAKEIIKSEAEKIILGGGKLNQSWKDESERFLDIVNDPQNLQKVTRVWNQLKKNYPPDVARAKLREELPEVYQNMENTDYFDYLFDQFNDLAVKAPFDLSKKDLLKAIEGIKPWQQR